MLIRASGAYARRKAKMLSNAQRTREGMPKSASVPEQYG